MSDPQNLHETVDEVFLMMLNMSCDAIEQQAIQDSETITAVVGFGGLLSGACVFRSGKSVALSIAATMTGMEFSEIDDMVKDAIGELCNMLAGVWKGKVPELSANCGLSIPAVITGRDYSIHVQAPEFRLHQEYRFEDEVFEVMIICDGLH
ncbi:chemotaxis protein CheX [Acidicapsa ligni]|uniref:chemotaxis protein CheX n=1 Tax=Acidicapsa ligni TaxID=542300 RepID=UPI0021DFC244|nr:chemotaxis protein CheX [Acidicapsa ligni]